jgi:hypothetical protein
MVLSMSDKLKEESGLNDRSLFLYTDHPDTSEELRLMSAVLHLRHVWRIAPWRWIETAILLMAQMKLSPAAKRGA